MERQALRSVVIFLEISAWLLMTIAYLPVWGAMRHGIDRPMTRSFYFIVVLALAFILLKVFATRRLGEIDPRGVVFHHRMSMIQVTSFVFASAFVATMVVPMYNGLHDHAFHTGLARTIQRRESVPLPGTGFGGTYPFIPGQHVTVAMHSLIMDAAVGPTARAVIYFMTAGMLPLSGALIALSLSKAWFDQPATRYAAAALGTCSFLFVVEIGRWLAAPSATPFALGLFGLALATFLNVVPEIRGESDNNRVAWGVLATLFFLGVMLSHTVTLFVFMLMTGMMLAMGWILSRVKRYRVGSTHESPGRPLGMMAWLSFGVLANSWYTVRMGRYFDKLVRHQFAHFLVLGSQPGDVKTGKRAFRSATAVPDPMAATYGAWHGLANLFVAGAAVLSMALFLRGRRTTPAQRRQALVMGAAMAGYVLLLMLLAILGRIPAFLALDRWPVYFAPILVAFVGLTFTLSPIGGKRRWVRYVTILLVVPLFAGAAAKTLHDGAVDTAPLLQHKIGSVSRSYSDSELAAIQWSMTYANDGDKVVTDHVIVKTIRPLYEGDRRRDVRVGDLWAIDEVLKPKGQLYLLRLLENDRRGLQVGGNLIYRFDPALFDIESAGLRPVYDSEVQTVLREVV